MNAAFIISMAMSYLRFRFDGGFDAMRYRAIISPRLEPLFAEIYAGGRGLALHATKLYQQS